MDLELSEDQQDLQRSVREVLEREAPVTVARRVVEEGKGAEELWARMVELDWPALAIGEAQGGLGLGTVELSVVAEQLGAVVAPGPFLATATQFVPAVSHAGDAGQKDRFVGAVANQGGTGALAVAEAAGRWEADGVATVAEPHGSGWRLSGVKHHVFEPGRADELVVAARLPGTSGEEGIVLAVVPQESVRITPLASVDATRQYGTVVLDGVAVDADRVLGEAGAGGPPLRRALHQATAALAAEMVGTCQGIFDIVHAYVGERRQFGVKIGSFQAIKHKLANMFVALESARATVYFAAAAIDEEDDRAELAVSMAKASAGDCQKLLAQEGIQCLGGIGYTWEHDMHLYVKRVKADAACFGTAAEHRARVATLLGL